MSSTPNANGPCVKEANSATKVDGEQHALNPETIPTGGSAVPEFTIHSKPIGQNGSAVLTVRIRDKVIALEKVDLTKQKSRADFAAKVNAIDPSIDTTVIQQELLRLGAELSSQPAEHEETSDEPDVQELLARMPQQVRDEARDMLKSPDLMQRILDDIAACGVSGEQELAAAIYLTAVSRVLEHPVSVIVQAQSSTGKSYLIEKVATLIPPEAVIKATAMSPKALVYMDPGTLCHKFVVGGERTRRQDDETADATKMLREMLSSGRISQLVTVSTDGGMMTQQIEQDGPIAYVETTTVTNIFNEDANRSLLLATDERRDQTARIVEFQAESYSGDSAVDVAPIIQRHHTLQRLLQQQPVVIPFAREIAGQFRVERVEARRAFPQLMNMVKASALLHQYQRQTDSEGRIVAERFDLQLAQCLCRDPLSRMLDGQPSAAAQRFLTWLSGWKKGEVESRTPANESFTPAEAAKAFHVSKTAVQGWLNELKDFGAVLIAQPHRGSQPAKWTIVVETKDKIPFADEDCLSPNDNPPTSVPDLAQILGKTKGKTAVPSEIPEEEGCDESDAPASDNEEVEQLGNGGQSSDGIDF